MINDIIPLDVSSMPDLLSIAEEVQLTKTPRLLQRNGEDVAILVPITDHDPQQGHRTRQKTKADYEAFRAAAGSWMDVDTDTLLADIRESRRLCRKPPVEL